MALANDIHGIPIEMTGTSGSVSGTSIGASDYTYGVGMKTSDNRNAYCANLVQYLWHPDIPYDIIENGSLITIDADEYSWPRRHLAWLRVRADFPVLMMVDRVAKCYDKADGWGAPYQFAPLTTYTRWVPAGTGWPNDGIGILIYVGGISRTAGPASADNPTGTFTLEWGFSPVFSIGAINSMPWFPNPAGKNLVFIESISPPIVGVDNTEEDTFFSSGDDIDAGTYWVIYAGGAILYDYGLVAITSRHKGSVRIPALTPWSTQFLYWDDGASNFNMGFNPWTDSMVPTSTYDRVHSTQWLGRYWRKRITHTGGQMWIRCKEVFDASYPFYASGDGMPKWFLYREDTL